MKKLCIISCTPYFNLERLRVTEWERRTKINEMAGHDVGVKNEECTAQKTDETKTVR